MNYIKKLMAVIILSCGVIVCSGCSDGTSMKRNSKDTVKSGNVEYSEGMQYKISAKDFDCEKICRILMPGYDSDNIPEEQENGCTVIEAEGSQILMVNGIVDYYKDDSASNIASLLFYYVIPGLLDMGHDSEAEVDTLRNVEDVKNVEKEIEDMCISGEDEEVNLIRAVKLGKKEIEDIVSELEKNGEEIDDIEVWETDEYIGLEYEIVKNDIPIMGIEEPIASYHMEDIWMPSPAYIQALIGNGKILYLKAQGMIQSDEPEQVTLISEEEAVQIVTKESENIITDKDWKVKDVKLEYVAIPDWSADSYKLQALIPYWCVIREAEDEEILVDAVRINAVTGGDLSYGE